MDIAGLSMNLSLLKVVQEANIAVMKMAMNLVENQIEDFTDLVETSGKVEGQPVNPNLGYYLDVSV